MPCADFECFGRRVLKTKAPPGGAASVQDSQTVINFLPFGILAMKVIGTQLRKNMLAP